MKETITSRCGVYTPRNKTSRINLWCAGAARVARADSRVPQLQLNKTWKLIGFSDWLVLDMYGLYNDTVLLALGHEGLHVLELRRFQLTYTGIADVYRVGFDAHTDTLLILKKVSKSGYNDKRELVSLRRNGSEWLEVQRVQTDIKARTIAVCDSRVYLGGGGGDTLYLFDVSATHNLRAAGTILLQNKFYGLACTRRDGESLVAFSHDRSVSLLRLASLPLRLEPLASIEFKKPLLLLFRGDLLLVAHGKNRNIPRNAITSVRVSGNEFTERQELLDALYLDSWALVGDRLVLWNWKTAKLKEVKVYDFA